MFKRSLVLVGVALLLAQYSFAGSPYLLTLQNDTLVSSTVYEFDVYIQSLSGSLNLTSYQIFLTYNAGIADTGALTFAYIDGSSGISTVPNLGVGIYDDEGTSKLAAGSNPTASTITTSPVRLGRFRLSSTVPFRPQTVNIRWGFGGSYGGTLVNINNANATGGGTYDNLLGNLPLPIELASFTASVIHDNNVEISWKTVSETNNYGFEIYRRRGATNQWTKITFVEGHGTTLTAQSYSHVDPGVTFGKYSYQIKQIDLEGKSKAYPEADVTVGVGPGKFVLAQNYPNPFNPSTAIEFAVPQNGPATMKVYNVLGQEVRTLFEGNAETTKIYSVHFDGSSLASGLYFYTLKSTGTTQTKRMMFLK